ncbi:MAG TPA: hypothetical protein VGM88_35100 [Kofleriaceae bacterium]|jgi:hypothetical protein
MTRALGFLLLAACGNHAPPPPHDAPRPIMHAPDVHLPSTKQYTTPQSIALPAPKIALPHQESFELRSAGAAPRAVLRYAITPSTPEVTIETRLTSRHLDHGVFSAPQALPAITDGFAAGAGKPDAIAVRALPGAAATKSPETDAYLAPWHTLLEGRRASAAFDARGQLGAVVFNDDPTGVRSGKAADELVQRLLAATVPLPVEAIGTGASWTVVTVLRQSDAYVKQTATYTLLGRAPGLWKLHVKLLRTGEEQLVAPDGLPRGATLDLVALFRVLEGDVTVVPLHPLVHSGMLSIESRIHARLDVPGQPEVDEFAEDTGTAVFATAPGAARASAP